MKNVKVLRESNNRVIIEKDIWKGMSDKKLIKTVLSYFKALNIKTSYPFYMDIESRSHYNLINFLNGINYIIKRKVPKTDGKFESEDIEDYVYSILPSTMASYNTMSHIRNTVKSIEKKYGKKYLFKKITKSSIAEKLNM